MKQKNRTGFTLIESLFAAMLIGLVVAAIAVSSGAATMVNGVGIDLSTAEFLIEEIAGEFIVIARHIGHVGAFARFAQDLLHDVVMLLGPEPIFLQAPAVNNVTDEVKFIRLGML